MDRKCIVFYFKKAEVMEIVSNKKKFWNSDKLNLFLLI